MVVKLFCAGTGTCTCQKMVFFSHPPDQTALTPLSFVEPAIAHLHSSEYLFMGCIDYINTVSISTTTYFSVVSC